MPRPVQVISYRGLNLMKKRFIFVSAIFGLLTLGPAQLKVKADDFGFRIFAGPNLADSRDVFRRGFREGFHEGYRAGFHDGVSGRRPHPRVHESDDDDPYDRGFAEGFRKGYYRGFERGQAGEPFEPGEGPSLPPEAPIPPPRVPVPVPQPPRLPPQ